MTSEQLESGQRAKFKEFFDLFDEDDSGGLSIDELATIMRFLG